MYHISDDGGQRGPLSLVQLAGERLQPHTLVWSPGMPDWMRADHIPEIAAILAAAVPRPVALRETSLPSVSPVPAPAFTPVSQPAPAAAGSPLPVIAMVLGAISMVAWCLPIVGVPVSIVGLVLGIKGLPTPERGKAMTGVVLSLIGLVASVMNAALGVFSALPLE